jgi:hypothetical protein
VAIVLATLELPPARLGVTHWSSRLLAAELGVSNVKVADVWREWGLAPWRAESFRFSTDRRYSRSAAQVNDPRSHDTSKRVGKQDEITHWGYLQALRHR